MIPDHPPTLQTPTMTISMCRYHCRRYINKYAFIYDGDTCSCGSAIPRDPVGDSKCRMPCSGDSDQICGDSATSSVYDGKFVYCNPEQIFWRLGDSHVIGW